ncbi:MAG: flavodoxin family protein, partial [Eubacteriales bacterium]|nr:flavodoxin family protein [Eubacteriales bacterium]
MKVLGLKGSPKRESSDTMHITRAFLKGMASAAPLEAKILHVADLHIQPCSGCFACWRNGGTCVHRDDMAGVLEKIQASDVLLVSYPLYCYGMPGPLKTLIDRILPLTAMTMRKVGERYEHDSRADTAHRYCQELCANTTASLMKLVRRRPNRPRACSAWLPVSGPPVVR